MRQNIIKDIILAGLLAGAYALASRAQGLPSYYELVEPGEELVTGKNYLIVTNYENTSQNQPNIAYNGYSPDYKAGKKGEVYPSRHPIPIINIRSKGECILSTIM